MANRFLSNIRINDAYTFPASDGSNGQVIVTDGSGNLAFANPATSSSASIIYRDNFTGDGSTVAFTLQNSLSDEDQTFIYIDGVYQEKGTYSLSTNTITFTTAPDTGHSIEVISVSGINVGPTTIYQDNFTGDGTTTDFTLAQVVDNEVKTMIYFNGVYQFKGTYNLNGTALSFDTAPANGVAIEVISIASAAAADYNQKVLFYGKANEAISKGDAVMLGGQEGDHFLLSKATQTAIAANHEYFLGLASQDLAQGEFGYVTEFGKITELDTSAYTAGDILWFDAGGSTAGALTTTEPAAPLAKIQVAAVIRSHQNEGVLFIRPSWYHELGELHDVNITSIADKDILAWNNTQGYWENTKTLGDITATSLGVGVTPTEAALEIYKNASQGNPSNHTPANATLKIQDSSNQMYLDGNSIIQTGTASFTIGNTQAANILFYTNASEKLRITSDGNIGIGTTSPTGTYGKLTVNGSTSLLGDQNTKLEIGRYSAGAPNSYIKLGANSNSLRITNNTDTADLLYINNDGSVLIGQATKRDQEKFAVVGNTLNYLAEIRETGTGGAENSGLLIYYPSAAPNSRSKHFLLNADNTATKSFLSSDGGAYFSGDVGIGVTSALLPSGSRGNLSVNGSAESILTLGIGGTWKSYYFVNSSATYLASSSGTPLIFEAGGTEKMRINSGGSVGINTTSTRQKLVVNGHAEVTALNSFKASYNNTDSYHGALSWATLQLGNNGDNRIIGGRTATGGNLSFYVNNTNDATSYSTAPDGTLAMRIASSGNVGINETSPTGQLHLSRQTTWGTSENRVININNTGAGGDIYTEHNMGAITWYSGNSTPTAGIQAWRNVPASGNNVELRFDTAAAGIPYERMRINSNGYLKVSNDGTYANSAGSYHEIITDAGNNTIVDFRNKSAQPYGLYIKYTAVAPNSTNYYYLLFTDSSASSRFIVWSNGNVVNQNGSYGAISDAKLKENIVDASSKLADLMQVKIRNYNLIGDDKKQLGVVAQELEEVFPSMIDESPDFEEQEVIDEEGNVTKERVDLGTTTKSVKYSVFVPMLIKAMQEQQEIINDLKSRIETLENN